MTAPRRTHWPAGHVISMTREWDAQANAAVSVATCQCGKFVNRVRVDMYGEQDVACEAHWSAVEAAAPPQAAAGGSGQ
jgi:hypothetical protein